MPALQSDSEIQEILDFRGHHEASWLIRSFC
jgi:hypothetical protein